jgi:hypothetical protein
MSCAISFILKLYFTHFLGDFDEQIKKQPPDYFAGFDVCIVLGVPPMSTPSIQDAAFIEVISDVIVRFHEHKQYKTETTALKALARRYPGLTLVEYHSSFKFYSRLLQATIQSLSELQITPQYKAHGRFLSFKEFDTSFMFKQLHDQFPNESNSVIQTFISWVIFWHYLK